MVEERNENLQNADGKNELNDTQENSSIKHSELKKDSNAEEQVDKIENEEKSNEKEKTVEEVVDEIEKNVASESEDISDIIDVEEDSAEQQIPKPSYKELSIKELMGEFQKLISEFPIYTIRKNIDEIIDVFEEKITFLKEKFESEKTEDSDAVFEIPEQKEFNYLLKDYKEKLREYRKERAEKLNANLQKRQELIEALKEIIDSPEYTFEERLKKFKEIRNNWRIAGSIPRDQYSNIWQTFRFHEERFYDLLDLDREYRDKIFQKNLEEKKQIIEKAKLLLEEGDVYKMFRELQELHKQWKEETGPVAREYREQIWEEFKDVTKKIHDKRRDFYKQLKEEFLVNLERKKEIIEKLKQAVDIIPEHHKDWQNKIKEVEQLREAFYKIGFVPKKNREQIWSEFKSILKDFNKKKNNFYKSLKALQKENLEKKLNLIKIAEELKDSEDWEVATEKFKQIQEEWKTIGHVPRKFSEKIWQDFRAACNHYFDRYYQHIRSEKSEEFNNFLKKKELLAKFKEQFKEVGDKKYNIDDINELISQWKEIGHVPENRLYINAKFNKFINSLYDKLNIDKRELSFLKFKNTVDEYLEESNYRKLDSEKRFVRQKIESIEAEIRQLENNMMFIKSRDENNPFKKEADKNVKRNKEILEFWKRKLNYLQSLNY